MNKEADKEEHRCYYSQGKEHEGRTNLRTKQNTQVWGGSANS